MPELPEVEILSRRLDERLRERVIDSLEVAGVATLKTVDPSPAGLHGRRIDVVGRRGKFLVLSAPPYFLVLHLARAGWIRWHDTMPAPTRGRFAPAVRLTLDDGSGFVATEPSREKRLAAYVVNRPEDVPGIARLGRDPLATDFTPAHLRELLAASGAAHIKTVLADQSLIAGIGNAYSDEILHAATMSPFAQAARLDDEAVGILHSAIQTTLEAALAEQEANDISELKDSKRAHMRVHGRTGEPCAVCGDTIRQVDLGTRSLQYCPACQTGGKVYADRRLSKLLR